MKYYLRIENENFGFVVDGIHTTTEQDKSIKIEDYNKFFELQYAGKQFRLKVNPTGGGLFDYLEEYTPKVEINPREKTELEILKEKQELLQKALDGILLGGAL